jgi:hypothetical protein
MENVKKCTQNFSENGKAMGHLGDLDIDGGIILN